MIDAVAGANDSVPITQDQYIQRLIDFLQLLDAPRQLLSAEDDLAESNLAISTNLVTIGGSIGSGWQDTGNPRRQHEHNAEVPLVFSVSTLTNGAIRD